MLEPCGVSAVRAVKAAGAAAVFRYAENLTVAELTLWTDSGVGVGIVGESRAPGWEPSSATGEADAKRYLDIVHGTLQVPKGMGIWDDIEEPSTAAGVGGLVEHIDGCGLLLAQAGDVAGDYVGDSCGLTSEEWQARPSIHAYWASCSRILDRFGKAVVPARGWCIIQGRPPNMRISPDAPEVDADFLTEDFFGGHAMLVWEEGVVGDTLPPVLDPDATLT